MIGFDSIGQAAIGELTGSADTIIFVPAAVSVAVTAPVPVVTAGASVLPGAKVVTVTAAAPSVRGGALVTAPAAAVAVTSAAAAVHISATVTAPVAAAVAVSAAPPQIGAGALVTVPAATVTVTKAAPFVTAGKMIAPPAVAVTVTAPRAGISISAAIRPAVCAVTVATIPPQILGGNYIEASNTIVMTTPYGEIGSASIGQFALGEGEPSMRIVKRGPLVIVSCAAPFIAAGKSIFPPSRTINVTTARPEIDSRGRKLRVLAIAS